MRLGPIVLVLRAGETRFNEYIGGTADMALALSNTLMKESAFVLPLGEAAGNNDLGTRAVNQLITERFGVVVALNNDNSDRDKTGIGAYDQLDETRTDLLKILVGLDLGRETVIVYKGAGLVDIRADYLWYQYEFEFQSRLQTDEGGFGFIETTEIQDRKYRGELHGLEKIYTNYILAPSTRLPHTGDLPLDDNFPDVAVPNMATWITIADDPNLGGYTKGFSSGFDWYNKIK